MSRIRFALLSAISFAPLAGYSQDATPYVGLRASAYLTQSALVNRGDLTGVHKGGGYSFRTRPGIMGDVLVDWKPRGQDAKWTFSSGVGIWWWSYRVGLRRRIVPSELYYLPSEGQGAIALQVPLRASYRLHTAVEVGAGVSLTRHLDGSGVGHGGSGYATDRAQIQVLSSYASRPYSSLTADVLLSLRATKRLAFSLRAVIDAKPFAPVSVTSTVTDLGGSRTYVYAGAPHFLLYCFGASCRIL